MPGVRTGERRAVRRLGRQVRTRAPTDEKAGSSMSDGTWTTTNGGAKVTISASGVGALFAAGYALTHPHQAGEAVSGAVTILAITVGALVAVAALAVFLKLRRRGRTVEAAEPRQPVSLL